ncbi:tetratricopeptide repeat protein [Noviherbaspirillum humi]|uniref:tetratricopeptide repeat protein n=1 Tax=Noviherbaspirillum humi TaxID=1688639 RepID=UPI00159512D1|nr:SEL1-like repeat protein [Noviherbaspirillum humi]
MRTISLASFATLTEQSERTLRRRIADKSLPYLRDGGALNKVLIPLDEVRYQIAMPIDDDDLHLIHQADAGDSRSQTDVALLFLEHGKPEQAIWWLEAAAKQEDAEAMHWLARCFIDGIGVRRDAHLGLMWLSRAAARGHEISAAQIQSILASVPAQPREAREAAAVF